MSPNAARERVRVARSLPALPLIAGAFGSGRLSFSQVRALTRVADAGNEGALVELARNTTAAQLEAGGARDASGAQDRGGRR